MAPPRSVNPAPAGNAVGRATRTCTATKSAASDHRDAHRGRQGRRGIGGAAGHVTPSGRQASRLPKGSSNLARLSPPDAAQVRRQRRTRRRARRWPRQSPRRRRRPWGPACDGRASRRARRCRAARRRSALRANWSMAATSALPRRGSARPRPPAGSPAPDQPRGGAHGHVGLMREVGDDGGASRGHRAQPRRRGLAVGRPAQARADVGGLQVRGQFVVGHVAGDVHAPGEPVARRRPRPRRSARPGCRPAAGADGDARGERATASSSSGSRFSGVRPPNAPTHQVAVVRGRTGRAPRAAVRLPAPCEGIGDAHRTSLTATWMFARQGGARAARCARRRAGRHAAPGGRAARCAKSLPPSPAATSRPRSGGASG